MYPENMPATRAETSYRAILLPSSEGVYQAPRSAANPGNAIPWKKPMAKRRP